MRIDIITLFPQMFTGAFAESIIGRARSSGRVDIAVHNLRDYTYDRHRTVDDTPYGGGSGMVLKPEPLYEAVTKVKSLPVGFMREPKRLTVFMTPQGQQFKQETARSLTGIDQLILVCGHYEGFDERARVLLADMEISIGDFVLTGGEIPAMAVTDAVVRLLPGVLGDEYSKHEESCTENLLEYPHYTRPRSFMGLEVPEVLLSGNHGEIAKWRRKMALERTKARRPDLLEDGSGLKR
ncbi:MAG: tRNA (guanosine(37)-N1)-methyltransferase TrmD [Bacillota bacterium]|nr:tRNA (guanosine(37)-N1)-methyltransferase TrmD [Bacillota bacterium]